MLPEKFVADTCFPNTALFSTWEYVSAVKQKQFCCRKQYFPCGKPENIGKHLSEENVSGNIVLAGLQLTEIFKTFKKSITGPLSNACSNT